MLAAYAAIPSVELAWMELPEFDSRHFGVSPKANSREQNG